ncbi:hypothetical protein HHI36_007046 [Cryptolaemus montrouzieri]|uniref:C2H2-type domain-containing protein n=1 Tax=Cryptolaemus montrouzieri TaxID=559131 RepID=A0ABD2MNM9_9CUCU
MKYDSSDDDQPLSTICKKSQLLTENHENGLKLGGDSSSGNLRSLHSKQLVNINSEEKSHEYCSTIQKDSSQNKCDYCAEIFNKKRLLLQHLKISHSEKCIIKRNENYTRQLRKSTEMDQKHVCTNCKQSFEFIKHLERHCRDTGHAFPKRFSCEVCSKKFLSNTRLNDHMRIHNNERPYKCNECDMTFTLSSNLKRHKKRHTGEKSYFCEVCGRGFIQKHTLTVHMRLHNGETPYVCDICGKGYRAKPLLHQHMYKHKDIETQTVRYQRYYLKYGKVKVECQICKKIITKSALYNHMKVQHGDGLKKFLCNLCGKTYATKMSLDVHMNVHTKKISYDCKICSKSFTHQNYLKTHLMLHSGERPHCCDLCGKTFVQKTHLDRHMRTHTGVRPYSCSYCDKAFALNENLKVHERIHTGETPHHCSVCGKGFFNSSSRKKHETSVHQMHLK